VNAPTNSRRSSQCLTDFVLDQLMSGDLEPSVEERVRAHLARCVRCAERLREFENVRPPLLQAPAEPARPARARRFAPAWLGAAATLLAVLGLGLHFGRQGGAGTEPTEPPSTRAKSALALEVVIKRESGEVSALTPGDTVFPGDALRFELAVAEPGFVAVLGLDAAGAVTPYAPSADVMLELAGGPKQVLPGAIVADATLGPERIVALSCPTRRSLAELVALAKQRLGESENQPARAQAIAPGCAETHLDVEKRARAR
jgi:anti-sigma factor RsiW